MSAPTSDQGSVAPIAKTRSAIEAAAKLAGISAVDISEYRKNTAVGELLREMGVLNLGLGMFAFSGNTLKEAIEKCATILRDSDDPEVVASIGMVQSKLIAQYRENAKNIAESVDNHEMKRAHPRVSVFPPGSHVTAVVVTEKKEHESKPPINI